MLEFEPHTPPPHRNPTRIYYIHPSYANSNHLVSIKFNGEGFYNWIKAIILTLIAKNKLRFVTSLIKKLDLKAWGRCNNLVRS